MNTHELEINPKTGQPYKLSKEVRARMSAAGKGKTKSAEHVENVRKALTGKPKSDSARANMRKPKTNKENYRKPKTEVWHIAIRASFTPERKAEMSASLKGHAVSAETRRKISDSKKGVSRPAWVIEKMIEGRKAKKHEREISAHETTARPN